MPRRNVSYRPVRYFLRRTNINSSRSKDQPSVKDSTNRLQAQNDSLQNHNKAGHSYPINNILVLPQNSETLINVIGSNNKNFSFKKVLRKLSNRRRKEKQRLKKAQAKQDIKPDITKMKVHAKKTTINRHTIILSDSEDDTFIKSELKNTSDKSTDKSSVDDDVILVEVNRENEVIEIEDSCNDDLNNSKADCANSSQYKTTERNELLSTPESSTSNDFLENSNSNINANFNFSLHGSEFKDSEFLKPSVPVDVSECGSISSVSDISSSVKANVFNVVDFPKERENLFDENNLEKFKDSITPQRHSLRDDANLNSSKDEQRNLPTLSHIQSDDSQLRRVRGRSIIRELVNDRAYVILASAEKKIKKKRKSRDEPETTSVDTEVGESMSSDSAKKKKKRKKKKDDEGNGDSYSQFTDDVESSNIMSSSPMKSINENKKDKNRKVETVDNVQDANQNFSLIVRDDLFPETETDTSVNSKKTKKKDKEISIVEEVEYKKKHKKSKKHTDESTEILLDSSKKRKKEKSVSECSGNETIEVTKHKSKKKKRKTLESEEISYQLITDDCDATVDKIEVSEVNETVTPLIKHQKKTQNPPEIAVNDEIIPQANIQPSTITEETEIDEKSCTTEITNIPTPAKNIDKNTTQTESSKELAKSGNNANPQTLLILNELPESNECKIEVISPETLEVPSIPVKTNLDSTPEKPKELTELSTKSDSIDNKNENVGKKIDVESPSDKSQSVWNMCSSNFFSSSESLFLVSDVRTVPEVENKLETDETLVSTTIDKVPCANSPNPSSGPSFKIITEPQSSLESNKDANINQIPHESSSLEQISTVSLKGNNCEEFKLTQSSTVSQNTDQSLNSNTQENEDVPILIEPKKETIDDTREIEVSLLQNIEINTAPQISGNSSMQITEEINVKEEPSESHTGTSNDNNSDVVTVIGSSFLSDSGKKTDTHISPEVIKDIIEEKDNIKSVTKLCEFLEGGKDPNDVLRKVSMIKQAFLASADTDSINVTTTKNDDVFSISSEDSNSSSIMCIENDTAIVDIEDDISLANCQLEIPKDTAVPQAVPQEQSIGLSKNPNDKLEDSVPDPSPQIHTPTSYALRCGEVGKYAKNLDQYEVEAIQKTMKNDPKLWQISPADLPSNRHPVRGKRCIRCKEIGHLVMHCPNKDVLPKCYICGLEGHLEFRCPNKICTKCGTKSANMQSFCDSCKHYSRITCSLCSMRGHPRNKCPDLWRRYHLTVDHGPIVGTDGMKLKNKEDLWCSSCSKRGHLEYYCYIAMKNRNFQQLDPRIHHYEDVYGGTSDMVENTSNGGVISKKTLNDLQSYLDNSTKKAKGQEPKTKEIPNEIPKKNVETSVRNPTQNNSSVGANIDNLPPDFVVVDEVYAEVRHQIPSGSGKNSVQINESQLNREKLEKSSSSVVVTNKTNVSKEKSRTDQDNSKGQTTSTGHSFQSIREYLRNSSRRLDYNRSDLFIPDCDMKFFFMNSDVVLLKKFLTKELEFLENFSVRVKDMFFKYGRYSFDLQRPVDRREISYERHAQFQKQLNMLLFGKEYLKGGKIFLTKLHSFVGTATGFFTDAMRESLYLAYEYIFSEKLQQHTQYIGLLRLLMDKYGYRKQ